MAITRSDAPSDHSSILIGLSGLVLALVARYLFLRIQEERKIQSLGSHAPTLRSWAPFGLGFITDTLVDQRKHALLERWDKFFANSSSAHRYTSEVRLVGTRLLMTADEENIKAILATQFHDYGKGEQFNYEWHDFLGDSMNFWL